MLRFPKIVVLDRPTNSNKKISAQAATQPAKNPKMPSSTDAQPQLEISENAAEEQKIPTNDSATQPPNPGTTRGIAEIKEKKITPAVEAPTNTFVAKQQTPTVQSQKL